MRGYVSILYIPVQGAFVFSTMYFLGLGLYIGVGIDVLHAPSEAMLTLHSSLDVKLCFPIYQHRVLSSTPKCMLLVLGGTHVLNMLAMCAFSF